MGVQIVKGCPEGMDAYIDFINSVFFPEGQNEFRTLLPKLFGPERHSDEDTYFLYEDSVLKACIGAFPITFSVGGETLRLRGIGNVATAADSRGKGYMKALMDRALDDMAKDGIDLSVLGGRRHRYAFHGFEKCDGGIRLYMSGKILNYMMPGYTPDMTLREITREDTDILDMMYEEQKKRPYRAERSREDFLDILSTWRSVTYGFFRKEKFVGWAVCYGGGETVNELVPFDIGDLSDMAVLLISEKHIREMVLPRFDNEQLSVLFPLCENAAILPTECFEVINWERVTDVLMKYAASVTTLCDGKLTVRINGRKETLTLSLTVKDNKPSVKRTSETPDITLGQVEAERFFFCNCSPEREGVSPYVKSWLPLPIFIYESDNV